MTNLRLSHSQVNKYQDCAKAWDYYYKQKIRTKTKSSALLFGNILDESVEVYLKTKDKEKAKEKLIENWTTQKVGSKEEKLYTCTKIVYSNSDYDEELITDEQLIVLKKEYGDDVLDQVKSIYKQKDIIGYDLLPKKRKLLLNKANWFSMLSKGLLMFDKVVSIIDDNVTEVLGTQVEVNLSNGSGDSVIGFADFVVKWKGYDRPIIFDLKTSSILYDQDSAKYSPQLTLYVHDLKDKFNTTLCGYLVLNKRVKKNRVKVCSKCSYDGSEGRHKTCPNVIDENRCNGEWNIDLKFDINYQVIIDEVSTHVENIVLDNIDTVNNSIKYNIFPRNLGSCKKPWGLCDYYHLCWNNSEKGLERKTEE